MVFGIYFDSATGADDTSQDIAKFQFLRGRVNELLTNCKLAARLIKLARPGRVLPFDLPLPSQEASFTMAVVYFRSFESTYRILHYPSFMSNFAQFWSCPDSAPITTRLKLLLVCGIGLVLSEEETNPSLLSMVHYWINAAQTWLSDPLEKDRLDVNGLQIYCLVILARQMFSIGGDLIWVSMGSLINSAMQIGLHRDPKHLPTMSILQAEVRRRLWTTILELNVQLSLDTAMPPRISLDDFDTEAPANINDEDMDESTNMLEPRATFTATSVQLVLLNSLPLRMRIIRHLGSLDLQPLYSKTVALSSELVDALHTASRFLEANADSGLSLLDRNLLDYFVRRFLTPLHCPYALEARKNPQYHHSLQMMVEAAMVIISPGLDRAFSRLLTVGGSIFREGFQYASNIISLEIIAEAEGEARRLEGPYRQTPYRLMLKQAMRNLTALSEDRVRNGETNIKWHMLLSMITGYVEALEVGEFPGLKMAQSAVSSVEFCHDLVQTRASQYDPPDLDVDFTAPPYEMGDGSNGFDFDLDFFLLDA